MIHPSPDQWPEIVEEFRSSGLQQKEFAAKHDLHLSTLQYWLYRASKRSRSKRLQLESKSSPKFLPIQVVASPAPKLARVGVEERLVEVALHNGIVLRFATGTDSRYLAELCSALG